ncbi:hypothetical protein TL16_g04583 [Triparma laevis f. inornata]|uniref:Uncharacterized protein n=2 Tax=Triparma laevis TaxID=1534972 RepID=A0A9W7FJ18_9STRA|nr:hypothetical protein TL16_g04583 [Triparma laevis f. inornata]GMI12975.1 hypothetical protein TrLO_g11071 [Triparma laevis f. longispina]
MLHLNILTFFLLLTTATSSLFGVIPRGGGLFSKGSAGAVADKPADLSSTSPSTTATKTYPAMTEEEVMEVLDDIPVYSVTDPSGQGVVLKNPETGTSLFYFYISPGMANATLGELKKSNPSLELQVQAYRLGQVYFKILRNDTSKESSVKLVKGESVESEGSKSNVEYRLVPDTRDLIGARMLLTMEKEDGEEVKKNGGMTKELAEKTIRKAMTESRKFNESWGEIPVFMIQQMRIQTKAEEGKPALQMLPMYFSLSDMVTVWQQFAASDPKAGASEPAIHLMSLEELVDNMLAGGEVDFKSVLLIAASGKEPVKPGEAPAAAPAAGMGGMGGGKTLGDL